MSTVLLLLVAAGAIALVMTVVWVISERITNAGIVDIAWSANFAVAAALYGLLADGHPVRRAIAAAMMILWSLRLATYLAIRVLGHIEVEDGRYAELRTKWSPHANFKLLGFFYFQGLTNLVLSIPVLIAAVNGSDRVSPFEIAGVAIWLAGLAGETVADAQLQRFKKNPANRGRVCTVGLWRYSRHPNYFFEWVIWIGYFVFALGSPYGWIAVYCPLLMLFFLYKLSGIPALEELAVRTKGEAYREYQRTTSPFIPWFPKRGAA